MTPDEQARAEQELYRSLELRGLGPSQQRAYVTARRSLELRRWRRPERKWRVHRPWYVRLWSWLRGRP